MTSAAIFNIVLIISCQERVKDKFKALSSE